MTVCTRKLPLSQGSVMPTDPGRKSPAASICRQRLRRPQLSIMGLTMRSEEAQEGLNTTQQGPFHWAAILN